MNQNRPSRPVLEVKSDGTRYYYPSIRAALEDCRENGRTRSESEKNIADGIQNHGLKYGSRWSWASEPPRPLITPGVRIRHLNVLREIREGYWLCQCECGRQVEIEHDLLASETANACGQCELPATQVVDNSYHKDSELYPVWRQFRERQKKTGIDHAWDDFEAFKKWAEEHNWEPKMFVYRLDTSKPYGPDNCALRKPWEDHAFISVASWKPIVQKENGQTIHVWLSLSEAAENLVAEGKGNRNGNIKNTMTMLCKAYKNKSHSGRRAYGYEWYPADDSAITSELEHQDSSNTE